jgi:hypothetical protein
MDHGHQFKIEVVLEEMNIEKDAGQTRRKQLNGWLIFVGPTSSEIMAWSPIRKFRVRLFVHSIHNHHQHFSKVRLAEGETTATRPKQE